MRIPTIFHIPHSSTVIPAEHRAAFLLSDRELDDQVRLITDHFTDELFDIQGIETTRIVFPVSRLVLDPERFIDDAQEQMAQKGMGVIYEKTIDGKPLRNKPSSEEREALIKRYYHPHHQRLTEAVDIALSNAGRCLIIDCHSFPEAPLPYEDDQSPNRPDICIGTDDFHTNDDLSSLTAAIFRGAGFSVALNRPFSGTIVPMKHFRRSKAAQSIMIEINRKLYMNETTGQKLHGFTDFAARFKNCLDALIQRFPETCDGDASRS